MSSLKISPSVLGSGSRVTKQALAVKNRAPTRFSKVHSRAATGTHLELDSPCKINLFLRIIRRRKDGFHDLASLFHVVDLCDSMTFDLLPEGAGADELSCNVADIPVDESNLVVKALNLFRSKTNLSQKFAVNLKKLIPHGAGLGGGSGNAATTLWAANELCGNPATNENLLEWSGEIGSDISVFFSKGCAYCTGRGEIVENVDSPIPLDIPLLLIKPPMGLSTGEIFKVLDLTKLLKNEPLSLMAEMKKRGLCQDNCVNDLERPAFSILPELGNLKEKLLEENPDQFSAVFMTGSGSTIVCAGSHEIPDFLLQDQYSDLFIRPARPLIREHGQWYKSRSAVKSVPIGSL